MAEETVSRSAKSADATADRDEVRHLLYMKVEQLESVAKAMTALEAADQSDLVGELAYVAEDLAGQVKNLLPDALREPAREAA